MVPFTFYLHSWYMEVWTDCSMTFFMVELTIYFYIFWCFASYWSIWTLIILNWPAFKFACHSETFVQPKIWSNILSVLLVDLPSLPTKFDAGLLIKFVRHCQKNKKKKTGISTQIYKNLCNKWTGVDGKMPINRMTQ